MSGPCYIFNLSEDLIGRILFSGYLSKSWYDAIRVGLVHTTFLALGKKHITYVDNRMRLKRGTKIVIDVLGIGKFAPNVVYLDFGYCNLDFNSKFGEMLVGLKSTLRGLSFRCCTNLNDIFLTVYVSKLTNLRFLDVSQISSSGRITENGLSIVQKMVHLKWLDISGTNATDQTVDILQAECPNLYHLALDGCVRITDKGFRLLVNMKLSALDITNCKLISQVAFLECFGAGNRYESALPIFPVLYYTGIMFICADYFATFCNVLRCDFDVDVGGVPPLPCSCSARSKPLYQSLEVLKAPFLPLVPVVRAVPPLLQLPRLRKLEFRKSQQEVMCRSVTDTAHLVRSN
jgi:hypothetical protein